MGQLSDFCRCREECRTEASPKQDFKAFKQQSSFDCKQITVGKLEKEKEIIKNVTISNMRHHREKTERCMRTAYHIAKEDRPYTDYEALINLQCKNGIYMGRTLHSRWSCTEMIDTAKESMVESLIKEIVGKERKISVIIDVIVVHYQE